MRQLTIEPEFQDKIPPLLAEEYSRLEANILEDGEVREPIVVWGNTIIDGHNRYKIVLAHPEIPFKVKQMNFADKWDAIVWMCHNQMGRRNLSDVQRTVLLAEAFKAQKMTHGGDRGTDRSEETGRFTAKDQNGPLRVERTKSIIAKQFGVGQGTVQRAEQFANGLDAAEAAVTGVKEAVLSGNVSISKSAVAEIRKLPDDKKREAAEAIMKGNVETAKEIIFEKKKATHKKGSNNPDGYSNKMREENKIISSVVSEMYNTEKKIVHTVDNLLDDLEFTLKDFIVKVNRSLEIYMDVLTDGDARQKVYDALSAFEEDISDIRRRVL